jgi:hypothetical protein
MRGSHDRGLRLLGDDRRDHLGCNRFARRGRDRSYRRDDRRHFGFGRRRSGPGLDHGLALEAAGVGQAADAVRRGLVDARRVALHPDLELVGKLDHDGVVNAELSCQLVDPDLLRRQNSPFPRN